MIFWTNQFSFEISNHMSSPILKWVELFLALELVLYQAFVQDLRNWILVVYCSMQVVHLAGKDSPQVDYHKLLAKAIALIRTGSMSFENLASLRHELTNYFEIDFDYFDKH